MTPTTCLLTIDMINEFTFVDAEQMFPAMSFVATRIAELKCRIKAAGLPVIYVNDNFGKWQSDLHKLVSRCLSMECRGQTIVKILQPEEDDYVVLKPKHSGFFATPLDLLLTFLHAHRLIITGVATNSCVLYTAADAYMRNYELIGPVRLRRSHRFASPQPCLGSPRVHAEGADQHRLRNFCPLTQHGFSSKT